MSALVESERRQDYAIIRLNRPEKMNAVSIALADALIETLASLEDMPVVVITGNGRAFCAGVDLSERPKHRSSWRSVFGADRAQYWAETIEAMRRHPAILIAAVNGYALGGGLTLVNNSELAVASRDAQFGMPELGFASFPALAGPTTARRLLPKHLAQLVFLPGRIDATVALRWGLVNEVVAPEDLIERSCQLAHQVAELDPVALAHTKRALRSVEQMGWSDGIEHGALVSATVQATRADGRAALDPRA